MSIVLLLAVLAVLAAVAVAATGRGGELSDTEPDRAPGGVLPDGDVDRSAIDGLRFSLGFRGYRMDEVDVVLDRVADQLEERDRRIAELEGREPHEVPADGWEQRDLPGRGRDADRQSEA